MNFLNFLTSADSVLNFNLANYLPANNASKDSLETNQDSAFKKLSQNVPQKTTPQLEASCDPTTNPGYNSMLEEQQLLINQYLQLNIQFLQKEIEKKQDNELEHEKKKEEPSNQQNSQLQIDNNKKKIKKTNKCGHNDKPHYAKGMCSNCYHKFGRSKKPWNCTHSKLYAAGLCQNCYINNYNKKKREEDHQEICKDEILLEEPSVKQTGEFKENSQ